MGAGGIFVRLTNDGDKVVGAFCGEPDAREVHWTGEKYEECTGPGCAQCAAGTKVTVRVSMNLFVPGESAMKVIEGGTMWLRDVLTVKDKYGLDKWTFEIKRVGKPKDPKTKYVILPEERIDEAMRKRIEACSRHDLARLGRGDTHEEAARASPVAIPAATITREAANDLLEVLEKMTKIEVDSFFRDFGITRLRELRVADEKAAREYLARAAEAAAAEEVPF